MRLRSATRTLSDLRLLLERLQKDRHQYNQMSLAQLRRIIRRRIAELASELRGKPAQPDNRRAA